MRMFTEQQWQPRPPVPLELSLMSAQLRLKCFACSTAFELRSDPGASSLSLWHSRAL